MTRLTVIVPTRSRPQNAKPIIDAWHATGAFGVADLCFGLDLDDQHIGAYRETIQREPCAWATLFPEWMPLVPKMNDMAADAVGLEHIGLSGRSIGGRAQGVAVAFMGDDHIPRTPRWAHALVEQHMLSAHPLIVYGRDGLQDRKLPTWWSMDSRIVQALGGMVTSKVQHLFCDNTVKELGKAAECLVYDDRILIEHMHPFAGKGEMDQQYERVNRNEQYHRDGLAFRAWVARGLAGDASLVRSISGG